MNFVTFKPWAIQSRSRMSRVNVIGKCFCFLIQSQLMRKHNEWDIERTIQRWNVWASLRRVDELDSAFTVSYELALYLYVPVPISKNCFCIAQRYTVQLHDQMIKSLPLPSNKPAEAATRCRETALALQCSICKRSSRPNTWQTDRQTDRLTDWHPSVHSTQNDRSLKTILIFWVSALHCVCRSFHAKWPTTRDHFDILSFCPPLRLSVMSRPKWVSSCFLNCFRHRRGGRTDPIQFLECVQCNQCALCVPHRASQALGTQKCKTWSTCNRYQFTVRACYIY